VTANIASTSDYESDASDSIEKEITVAKKSPSGTVQIGT
jgi:hypothetical protein